MDDDVKIGTMTIDEIPLAPKGIPQIEVTYELDSNETLNLTAIDKSSNKKLPIYFKYPVKTVNK